MFYKKMSSNFEKVTVTFLSKEEEEFNCGLLWQSQQVLVLFTKLNYHHPESWH